MRLLLALLLALTLAGCGKAPVEEDRLPDVTLPGLAGGEQVDLGALRGPVVVNLWASWCVPCKRELPLYQQFSEKYDGRVAVLGIRTLESIEAKSLEMLRTSGVTFPVVADDDGATRTRFLPRLLLLDAKGRVVHDEYVEIKSLGQLEDLVAKHLGVKA